MPQLKLHPGIKIPEHEAPQAPRGNSSIQPQGSFISTAPR